MKKTEKIFGILILLIIILKFNLIPGTGILLVVTSLLTFVMYSVFGLSIIYKLRLSEMFESKSYSEISKFQLFISVLSSFSLAILTLGNLFKLQFWPGANSVLLLGLAISFICIFISYIKFNKSNFNLFKNYIYRFLLIGTLSIVLLSLSIEKIEKIRFRNHPLYLKAYDNFLKNPNDLNLKFELEKEETRAILGQETYDILYRKN
jgi:hypothetical protein